ncbi:MAG: protoheme IX farnesyltransferase [Candidatus Omnitrophica bacterium CG11_big_fil_rev_8_21_14_0_20_64_10]|nr:MAG: protoheme IX farnesyltransferase [Candidatus Omnitrophica bacterium CG11_big_fil_rev_8_21_14_0_20_64_10]
MNLYLELSKARLTTLAAMTAGIGFWLAAPAEWLFGKLLLTLAGTAALGAGSAALNQLLEKEADGRMNRTKGRPLPSGRISEGQALTFGVAASCTGLITLTLLEPLAGGLAAFTLISYLFLYTPLKRRTALCTLVGAVPGAMPPLIGWAAARGELSLWAWLLFGILFLWQLPHFLAIAGSHLEDYRAAGFKMLPVVDLEGRATSRQILLYCLALVPVSLLPATGGFAGGFYFGCALVGSLAFLGTGVVTARARSARAYKRLFFGSILYLPFIFTTLALDKVILT